MSEIIEEIAKLQAQNPALTVSIVGSGGKSTLMKQLAQELAGPVLCATSTKLGTEQALYFDQHIVWNESEKEAPNLFPENAKSYLISSGIIGDLQHQRINNLSETQFEKLHQLCLEKGLPLVIEADGAKCRSLKAPETWEPVIPTFTDLVVVIVGLRDLMKPLSEEVVFRSELFSKISGLPIGAPIDIDAICHYLIAPLGGLKGIPKKAKTFVYFVIAGCENPQLVDKESISKTLQSHFDKIFYSD